MENNKEQYNGLLEATNLVLERAEKALESAALVETAEENMARLERELYRNPLVAGVSIMTHSDMDRLKQQTESTLGWGLKRNN